MGASTAQEKPSDAVIRQYDKDIRSAKHCGHIHDVFAWAYDITSKFMLIAGVAATAVAGVTATADLLGKTVIGGIAMAAAVLTALGAASPWDARAAEHWKLASKYQGDAFALELDKLEATEGPQAKQWIDKLRAHQRRLERLDLDAASLAEARSTDAEQKREARQRRRGLLGKR